MTTPNANIKPQETAIVMLKPGPKPKLDVGVRLKGVISLVLSYIALIAIAVVCIYPILWIIMASFNPGNSLFSTTLIPSRFTLSHYSDLFTKHDFVLWYTNTLKISIISMSLAVILVVITSYALSQFRFKGRKTCLVTTLVLQMFPNFMTMIAVYLLLQQLNLLDTHLGLILMYAGGAIPGGTWIVKGYFDSIPRSLPEAAKIDGANSLTIFFRIMMPLSVPILTFVAMTNFIGPWMDFIFARLVLRSNEKITMAIALYSMVSGRMNTEFTMFAAGAVMVALPITLLFVFLQKFLITGLAEGASKM